MGFDSAGSGDVMFTLVPLLMVGLIIFAVVKGIAEWNSNNQSPKLTVPAMIVTKRTILLDIITGPIICIHLLLHIMLVFNLKVATAPSLP